LLPFLWALTPAAAQSAALPNVTIKASEVINLWPGVAPGETGTIGPERVLPDRPRPFDQIDNVSVPTLSVFLPPAEKRTGTAMLVIPGGGLERLAIEHEGYEVAEWLNERGIAAFVLKHRVPARSREQRWKAGVQDAQRAMGLIRSKAAAWQVDGDAIGSIGFSAGAEIGLWLSVLQRERQYPAIDAADELPTRPNFNIAIYGGGFADARNNTMREEISSRISDDLPPMFVAHAFDDAALNSIILMNALKRANVASELHVFAAGGHGFGVRDTGLPVGHWRELCMNWLRWQGYLDAAGIRSFTRDYLRARGDGAADLPRFTSFDRTGELAPAFAAQRRMVRQLVQRGAVVAGYKGAFTSAPAQAGLGLTHPLHGVLFKAGRIDVSPRPIVIPSPRPLVVETELGYVMATDISTRLTVPRQAMTTVEAIVPVIEIPVNPGSMQNGVMVVNAIDAVAANVGSHRYIVGPAVAPATLANPDALKVSLRRDGQLLHEGSGADAKGGQAVMLMTLINQIVEQGHVIRRGDLIISGALGRAHPGEKGMYEADFGMLGKIEFRIE
jgi:2-keto-4-pentenoate hydratase/acetyl esterase/lipase